MTMFKYKAWIVLILLVAAVLRVVGVYNTSPPGLEHDEVANWLIDRTILDEGKRGVYFEEAYGHEAGFHYVQAASIALLGDHALGLRFPAMMAGLLVVAVSFALARKLFGVEVAIIAAAFTAVIFWPIFYSRLGLRAISLPVISGLSLIVFWSAWTRGAGAGTGSADPRKTGPNRARFANLAPFALAGLLAGLAMYTYMAARALPIFYAAWVAYLVLFHRARFRQAWRGVVLFGVVFTAVALPLAIYLQTNPGAEFRISEVDAPLRALLAGDPGPVLTNAVRIAGMFGFSGDPLWRQNVAYRPVFDQLTAVLFYAGVALAIWRWRDARYALLLLWMAVFAIPSLVTVDAPSSIRLIGMLLTFAVFPALIIHTLPRLSTVIPGLSTTIAYLLAGTLVLAHIWWTAGAVFHTWPENDEVQFVWQAALTETAAYLDGDPAAAPAAIGGWSPATMDPPTMFLSMRRSDIPLRYFGSDSTAVPITTLIVPAAAPGTAVRVTHPAIRTLAPELEAQLVAWSSGPRPIDSFVLYELPSPVDVRPETPMTVTFGNELQLLGYTSFSSQPGSLTVLTFWRVLERTTGARRFFLHAVDGAGNIVAQHDGNDAPAVHWQVGDLLVQAHGLDGGATAVDLRLGVYDPVSGTRLLTAEGADSVALGQ